MLASTETGYGRRLRYGYYLDNFALLLGSVEARYGDLLGPSELQFLEDFRALALPARRLWVSSDPKDPVSVDRLRYPSRDSGRHRRALADGFAEETREPSGAHLLALATPASCASFGRRSSAPRQDGTEFVLRDLRSSVSNLRVARSRARSRAARPSTSPDGARREEVEGLATARPSCSNAPRIAAQVAGEGVVRHRADRLVLPRTPRSSAAALGSHICPGSAVEEPPARERRARLLARRGALDRAAGLCREIATSPRDESERVFAEGFGRRLEARRAGVRSPKPRPAALVERELRAPRSSGSVEAAALGALAEEGYRGFFAENWLWRALFGLAFWDVGFAPVPGRFAPPFQYGPLDLYSTFGPRAAIEEIRGMARSRSASLGGQAGIANLGCRGAQPHLTGDAGDSPSPSWPRPANRDLARYGHGHPTCLDSQRGSWMLAEAGPRRRAAAAAAGWSTSPTTGSPPA